MSDTPSAVPAGASEQASAPEPIGPMDLETAVSRLASLDEQESADAAEAATDAADQETIDNPEAEGEGEQPEAETEETAPIEDAEPGEEPEPDADAEEDQYVHGNARTRLRDGTVTTVGELKKLAEEAREYRAKAPEITAQQRQIEERAAQLAQQEQFVQQVLPLSLQVLQSQIPPEPDPELLHSDPLSHYEQRLDRGLLQAVEDFA